MLKVGTSSGTVLARGLCGYEHRALQSSPINSGNGKPYNDLRSKLELLSTSFLFMQDGTSTETVQDSVQGGHVKRKTKLFHLLPTFDGSHTKA
jgi:hypothetical protein